MSKKKKTMLLGTALIAAAGLAGIFITMRFMGNFPYATSHENPIPEQNEELPELLSNDNVPALQTGMQETGAAASAPDEIAGEQEPGEPEEMPPGDPDPVRLSDIYAEKGDTAIFRCFEPDAESYEWEYYDRPSRSWRTADAADTQSYEDELHRQISGLKTGAGADGQAFTVRCTIHFTTKEDETQTASLFILPDPIEKISVDDLVTDAERYLCVNELPVKVSYKDGREETIKGLNGMHFMISDEQKDHATMASGNRIETTTLVTTECDYLYTGSGEKDALVRYRPGISEEPIETSCQITGKDQSPPVISGLEISPYEVSNIDTAVTLTVSITAEDGETPYPDLEYAFVMADQDPEDTDWTKKPSFDVRIERNGTYAACVRDRSGNTAKMEQKIITVDTKAPVITSVSLSKDVEEWCKSNTIQVEAKDAGGEISYCFENKPDGISSGWTTYSDYTADANGVWTIKAKDTVGNISETEITISNIDRDAPVIRRISVKE